LSFENQLQAMQGPVAPERIRKWGHRSGEKVGRGPPLFGSKSTISRFWWTLSWWSAQFGQFLVCCSSTHGAPVPSHL